MTSQIQNLSALVRHLLSYTGWRAVLLIVPIIVRLIPCGVELELAQANEKCDAAGVLVKARAACRRMPRPGAKDIPR